MSLTPTEIARSSFSQAQANNPRHVFQGQSQLPTPSPAQQAQAQAQAAAARQQAAFAQQAQQVQRVAYQPQSAHQSPYNTPYAKGNGQAGPSRQQNGGTPVISAEQQIAQGVLSNPSVGSGTNTPQRRPPPLGTTIHMPNHGGQQVSQMSVNNAVNAAVSHQQGQRSSHSGSPMMGGTMNLQRPLHSPATPNMTPNMGVRTHDNGGEIPQQDLSMIDPQLEIDHQLHEGTSVLGHQESAPPVVQGEMLSAPPGGSFPTFEALFASAQSHALAHGYAFVIGRSKRDNRGLKKVFLICDRGGNNKEKVPGEQRQRKTKSRKCGCEFGVFGLEGKTSWLLRGRIDGEHLTHNHPPSESPTEHPGARKLDPKAIAAVKALEENGVSVKETLEILHRENPTVRYLPRDIYNARAAIKRDPSRVDATSLEELPTFYKKPPMTFEEKLRAELRTEVANAQAETERVKAQWQKEVEELREELKNKDKMISKFEMFIDICNERVMAERFRLEGEGPANGSG